MAAPFMNRVRGYDALASESDLRGILGAALVADWRQAFIARGFGWLVDVGTLTTPIVGGGAGTVLDLEQPELAINVPSGFAMVPLRIAAECQIGLQTTDAHENEIWFGFDRTQVQTAGTSTAESPANLRSDITSGCPFTAFSAYTADGIATPVITALARKAATTDLQGIAANLNVYQFDLVYEPLNPPVIIGPAHIAVYWGGDIALPGFAQATVLCFPSSLVNGLS
jgi:hypothetical protein